MDKHSQDTLPEYGEVVHQWTTRRRKRRIVRLLAAGCLVYALYSATRIAANTQKAPSTLSAARLREDFASCASLQRVPDEQVTGVRDANKRWQPSTKPVLIRNATVWTGEAGAGASGKGYAWITADVLLDRGLIQRVASSISVESLPHGTQVVNASGRQLTSGIVDMHSHAGLGGFASLGDDTNELSSDITPYVRSLDGLDPLHPEIQWIKSGGVTTSLLLPGSGNNMGGEAFVVKLAVGNSSSRPEVSQQDMLADPDKTWRYMKMACGENPKRVYGKVGERGPFSRLGEAWEFRHALEQATDYVAKQNDWCTAAASIGPEAMSTYLPKELRWDSLGALLRGQVRLNTHCYTVADLEAFVRHTNEFKFRVRAFHHAHQTFLVPEILKRAWGGIPPAAALFADNMYYKVEAYTASEEAGKILYQDGITPVYVSDNPVINSQHVVFEAAKAYTYGLPYHVALAGVTSAPAALLGLGERVGKVKAGFDADIVLWDSDPLSVGAAPVQVWIDGAAQFKDPVLLKKPILPPIKPESRLATSRVVKEGIRDVIFTGVSRIMLRGKFTSFKSATYSLIVSNGIVTCVGECLEEKSSASPKTPAIHLQNGTLSPPFTAFGSGLGLVDIDAEKDTQDGEPSNWSRAVDGLLLGGKQVTTAYTHGVTKAISAPSSGSIEGKGVSVGFSTGAKHALEKGAVWRDEVSVHYTLTLAAKDDSTPSISFAIAALRSKLLTAVLSLQKNETDSSADPFAEASYLDKVVKGQLALVLTVHSADTIASIVRLKTDVESALSKAGKKDDKLRIVLLGAAESYLVASSLAASNISVVLAPLLPHAQSWDQRRSLTGAPLTNGTAIDVLLDAGVLVAIGVDVTWATRELGWLAGWAYRNGEGRVSEEDAFDLVGGNLYKMLGIERPDVEVTRDGEMKGDWVMWEGNPLETGARVRGVGDGGRVSIWM